jgi:hypothetical protein
MAKSGKAHIVGGLVGAGLSILALAKGWPIPAGIVIVAVDLYLVLILVVAALRRDGAKSRLTKFDFPTYTWFLLFFACLAICTVCGFASLYVGSKGVIHLSQDLADIDAHTLVKRKPDVAAQLTEPFDALYFSVVTLSTVGYGDYVPASAGARLLVTWEIGTGALLVAGTFALLISRISGFKDHHE